MNKRKYFSNIEQALYSVNFGRSLNPHQLFNIHTTKLDLSCPYNELICTFGGHDLKMSIKGHSLELIFLVFFLKFKWTLDTDH